MYKNLAIGFEYSNIAAYKSNGTALSISLLHPTDNISTLSSRSDRQRPWVAIRNLCDRLILKKGAI
jgi:hypothetical protein